MFRKHAIGRAWPHLMFLFAVLLVSLACAAPSEAEHHEGQAQLPWDQAKVTELTAQLAKAVSDVRSTALNDPVLVPGNLINSRVSQRFLETLKQLERSTGQLARKVANGENRSQTLNVARNIGQQLRDAREQGRRLDLGEWTMQKIDVALKVIEEVEPYYKSAASN